MLTISRPVMIDGLWNATARAKIGPHVVYLHVRASKGLVDALYKRVRFGVSSSEFGCAGCGGACGAGAKFGGTTALAMGDDDFGGLFDSIVNVVKKVADSPIIRAIPYAGTIAAGVSAAASVYQEVRAGVPRAKKRVRRIKADAARGVPAAKKALEQLRAVEAADRLRRAAKEGHPSALRRLRAIGHGISRRDPRAFEAAKVIEHLESFQFKLNRPRHIDMSPMTNGEWSIDDPIVQSVSLDNMSEDEAAQELLGAVVRKRKPMSTAHQRLARQLMPLVSHARSRAHGR